MTTPKTETVAPLLERRAEPSRESETERTGRQEVAKIAQEEGYVQKDIQNVQNLGASMGISLERSGLIFTQGGFAEKYNRIVSGIFNLTKSTKDRVESIVSGKKDAAPKSEQPPELLSQQVTPEPIQPLKTPEQGFAPSYMVRPKNLFQGVPRDERKGRLEEFKNELHNQKIGMLDIEDSIREIISTESEDLRSEDIYQALNEKMSEYSLNSRQKSIVAEALRRYEVAHRTVSTYREAYPNDKELFTQIFGFSPTGNLSVIEGRISLAFMCSSQEDVAQAYTGYHMHEGATPEGSMNIVSNLGGFFVAKPRDNIPDVLVGKTIVISTEMQEKYKSEDMLLHEQQHADNHLFEGLESSMEGQEMKLEEIIQLPPDQQESEIKRIFKNRRSRGDEMLADELLATYRGKEFTSFDLSNLARRLETNYTEQLYEVSKHNAENDTLGLPEPIVSKVKDEIFPKDNRTMIYSASLAIMELRQTGLSQDQVIAVLRKEPLRKWHKTAMRFKIGMLKGAGNQSITDRDDSILTATEGNSL